MILFDFKFHKNCFIDIRKKKLKNPFSINDMCFLGIAKGKSMYFHCYQIKGDKIVFRNYQSFKVGGLFRNYAVTR